MTVRIDPNNPDLIDQYCRGIMVHPPGTDSLLLTFDAKGRLCQFMTIPLDKVSEPLRGHKFWMCFPLFCKTTGETDQHMAICLLLRMLRDRYIGNMKVDDETGYFETGDLKKLHSTHGAMAGLIGAFKSSPALMKGLMKAAGMDEKEAEGLEILPDAPQRKAKAKSGSVN